MKNKHLARILIVDDEPGIRQTIPRFLDRQEMEVATAASVEAALEKLAALPYDVVVTDIIMPRATGIDLLREMQERYPTVKVIVITGEPTVDSVSEALRHRAFDYLPKPIEGAKLRQVVRNAVQLKKLEDENRQYQQNLEALVNERTREIQQYSSRLESIAANAKRLLLAGDENEFGREILALFAQNVQAEGGCLYRRCGPILKRIASLDYGHASSEISLPPEDHTALNRLFAENQGFVVEDIAAKGTFRPSGWDGYKDGSLLMLPCHDKQGEISLVITLHNKKLPPFVESDLILGRIIASFSQEAYENLIIREALRESERRYRLLVEESRDVVFCIDAAGIVTYCSPASKAFGGYEPEECVGRHYSDFIGSEQDKQTAAKTLAQSVQQNRSFLVEYSYLTKSGKTFPVEVVGNPVMEEGSLQVNCSARDITERKIVEEKLLRRDEQLRGIADAVPGIVYQFKIDQNGTMGVTYISSRTEAILGIPNNPDGFWERVIGMIDPRDRDEFLRSVNETIQKRSKWHHEGRFIKPNGEILWLRAISNPTATKDHLVFNGIIFDITEEKRLETQLQQAQKMESIGRLAGGVAHDFNNLLTGIAGYAEILMSSFKRGDPLFADLCEIKKAADRGARLTAQLLAFSRKQIIAPQIIDLNEVVDHSLMMVKRLIGEDIELKFSPISGLGSVKADPTQIEQVLVNLSINARDAMPNGGLLRIETKNVAFDAEYCNSYPEASPGEYVMLAVSDNGSGIRDDLKEHIFEPFFTTKEKGKGTGLGLATVYGIVKQNGGFINLYSELGLGTNFKIYLPRVAEKAVSVTNLTNEKIPGGHETILLVEDEEMVRNLAMKILLRYGYHVLTATSGGDAYLQCKTHDGPIDLLLTDVIMPTINGRQLYENVKTVREKIKVLFMSGYTEDVIAHHGVLDEHMHFLQKPFTIETLARKVRQALDD
ncbi:MAG TPA: response regulator [bacterium]|nr:response regulator [bacterium]